MFEKVTSSDFIRGEHEVLRFWHRASIFSKLRAKNAGKPRWSFIDGPITANNPMGVHHAWGRTYKDVFQRYFAMTGHDQRYQNGFDCQGLWVEVEVERELQMGAKAAIEAYGIDKFVNACKAARAAIRRPADRAVDPPGLLDGLGRSKHAATTFRSDRHRSNGHASRRRRAKPSAIRADAIVARLGNPAVGRQLLHVLDREQRDDLGVPQEVFRAGQALQRARRHALVGPGRQRVQPDGSRRRPTAHHSPLVLRAVSARGCRERVPARLDDDSLDADQQRRLCGQSAISSMCGCKSNRDHAIYYFAKDNLHFQRLEREFKEGFGRPEWVWPSGVPKLKTIAQIFKEQGGFETRRSDQGRRADGSSLSRTVRRPARAERERRRSQPIRRSRERPASVRHRVIDGGRDSRGNPNVVAGEGTGIVHIAPGLRRRRLCRSANSTAWSVIAPLDEAGQFIDGFGPFHGQRGERPADGSAGVRFAQRKAPARQRRRVSAHLSVLLADRR